MKKIIFILLSAIALSGCWQKRELVEVKQKKYLLVGINPPKHFYINLKDIETGRITGELRVSKRCSAWQQARIHEVLTFPEYTYQYADGSRTVSVNVEKFCDQLKRR